MYSIELPQIELVRTASWKVLCIAVELISCKRIRGKFHSCCALHRSVPSLHSAQQNIFSKGLSLKC